MSRPSAKLCAECFPAALRAVRPSAPVRGVTRERGFATQRGGCAVAVHRCRHSGDRFAGRIGGVQALRVQGRRGLATTHEPVTGKEAGVEKKAYIPPTEGPLKEYDVRVQEERLRDDPYQRGWLAFQCSLENRELICLRDYPTLAEFIRGFEIVPPAPSRPSKHRVSRSPTETVLLWLVVRPRCEQAPLDEYTREPADGVVHVRRRGLRQDHAHGSILRDSAAEYQEQNAHPFPQFHAGCT